MKKITVKLNGLIPKDRQIFCYASDNNGSENIDGVSCRSIKMPFGSRRSSVLINSANAEVFVLVKRNGFDESVFRFPIDNGDDQCTLSISYSLSDINEDQVSFSLKNKKQTWFSRLSRGKKKIVIFIAAILIIGVITGLVSAHIYFSKISKIPKVYETDEISITLTHAFEKIPDGREGVRATYGTENCWVTISRDSFYKTPMFRYFSEEEYCRYLMDGFYNHTFITDVTNDDGLTYFAYKQDWDGQEYVGYFFAFKKDDAFWNVEIRTYKEYNVYWSDCYFDWVKSFELK